MNMEEDIIIFDPKKKQEPPADGAAIEELRLQVVSGHLNEARALGKALADTFPRAADRDELVVLAKEHGIELTRECKDHAIILTVFAAEYTLHRLLNAPIAVSGAVSALYDALLKDTPVLYQSLLQSTDFSFYYLACDDASPAQKIGETYAMLCSARGDEKLCAFGTAVFTDAVRDFTAEVRRQSPELCSST